MQVGSTDMLARQAPLMCAKNLCKIERHAHKQLSMLQICLYHVLMCRTPQGGQSFEEEKKSQALGIVIRASIPK